jgi:hypothetical protein
MQAVRRVFDGKEDCVPRSGRAALVDPIGRHVDQATGADAVHLPFDAELELALQHVDPLLVGMRVRIAHLSGGRAHSRNDHALALDAAAEHRRVAGAAHDLAEPVEVEHVFAAAGLLRAGGEGCFSLHARLLRSCAPRRRRCS